MSASAATPLTVNDEFAYRDDDDSFLNGVDLDAVMAPYETPKESKSQHHGAMEEQLPSKRAKLSPSTVALHQNPKIMNANASATEASLLKTLHKHFGHSAFRPGQLQVINAILSGRDVAVFWPTGQGKSLLYQVPALLGDNKLVIVISPLISLMQDQVHKLNYGTTSNNTAREPIATFLGSAQTDCTAESQVFQPHSSVRVVYVTPEKLAQFGFLAKLASVASRLVCIAVDEAHCVSSWGHDFRSSYQQIGKLLRGNDSSMQLLRKVPILALTATATPRVQEDLFSSLRLRRDCFVHKQSLDRSNLVLKVRSRMGGIPTAMRDLVHELKHDQTSRTAHKSTIVYAATRKEVEDVAAFLQQLLDESNDEGSSSKTNSFSSSGNGAPLVAAYHAGLSNDVRQEAHINFLTGQTPVIVSTVAFGMGIDKPDTRRVIHYGPPKTLEDYYQQIGRAGRDGLTAECVMYSNPADYDKYKSDFYLGNLNAQAKEATTTSIEALRSYSLSADMCRRKALLTYFEEVSPFGDRCGTCDVCRNVMEHGEDAQRDFANSGAHTVLTAIDALKGQGTTQILKVLSGGVVEEYRYASKNPVAVQQAIEKSKSESPKKLTQDYYKELIMLMTQKGFLAESSISATVSGFSRSWTVYSLTEQGRSALVAGGAVVLPVPTSVREHERKEEEKRQQVLAKLEANGISREKLPAAEVLAGDGEVIRSYTKWQNYLEMLRNSGKEERMARMESLLKAIETWRSTVAVECRLAPASVMAEHLMVSIAYTQATLPAGVKVDQDSLHAAGVRARSTDVLVESLSKWVDLNQPRSETPTKSAQSMLLDPNGVQPTKKWYFAVYKPNKKTGMAVWESSYNRFANGESPQAIAMSQPDGKQPIQAATVVGHILDAFAHGKKVEMHRLTQFVAPPNQEEWNQLQAAEASMGMNVSGDPATSGRNGDKFLMTDLLRPIVGEALVDKPFKERSQADSALLSAWYDKLKWYMAFRRVENEPTFESS